MIPLPKDLPEGYKKIVCKDCELVGRLFGSLKPKDVWERELESYHKSREHAGLVFEVEV
jgi:hypothetical protein